MPKSKRNKVVALTRTERQGFAGKEALVTDVSADARCVMWERWMCEVCAGSQRCLLRTASLRVRLRTPMCLLGTEHIHPSTYRPIMVMFVCVLQIQKCLDEYASAYIFSVHNMRNAKLKDVRTHWRTSRYVNHPAVYIYDTPCPPT